MNFIGVEYKVQQKKQLGIKHGELIKKEKTIISVSNCAALASIFITNSCTMEEQCCWCRNLLHKTSSSVVSFLEASTQTTPCDFNSLVKTNFMSQSGYDTNFATEGQRQTNFSDQPQLCSFFKLRKTGKTQGCQPYF